MAEWPVLVVILILTAGFAATGLLLFFAGRHVVRRVWHRRDVADGMAARAAVSLPSTATQALPAHVVRSPMPAAPLAPLVPLRPAAPPTKLLDAKQSPVSGRHSWEHQQVDSPTTRIPAVAGPGNPVQPPRGHRAASPTRPANAPRVSDSGGHRAHHGHDGMVAGARLTSPR